MKEVSCLCGERVVFLDPELRVKTCPNCGMSVYQEGVESALLQSPERRRKARVTRENVILALAILAVLVVVTAVVGVMTARGKAFGRARDLVKQADMAVASRDYDVAIDSYRQALEVYLVWFAGDEATEPIKAALEKARQKKQTDVQAGPAQTDRGSLSTSLEDLAGQAYSGSPDTWEETFARDFADHVVVLSGKVQERSGEAYKASSFTMSYRVFSQSGEEMQISFDPPFFEKYRLESGSDCIVKAHLSKMRLDKGAPGGKGRWVLVIDGAKSSLVTDISYLRDLGWKIDDEVENLVSSQASLSPAF